MKDGVLADRAAGKSSQSASALVSKELGWEEVGFKRDMHRLSLVKEPKLHGTTKQEPADFSHQENGFLFAKDSYLNA